LVWSKAAGKMIYKGASGWNKGGGVSSVVSGGKSLTMNLKKATSAAEVLKAVDRAHVAAKPLDMVSATTAIHKLGKFKSALTSASVKWLLGELKRLAPVMDAYGAANTVSGLANMSAPVTLLLWNDVIERSLKLKPREFKPWDISNLMWGLATAGVPPGEQLVKAMSAEAVSKAMDFKPQDISNLMWALAKLDVSPDAALIEAMSVAALMKSVGFSPQDISNLMWAYAKLRVPPDAKVVQAMSAVAVSKARIFKPENIVNLMWALAKLDVTPDEALVQAMSAAAVSKAKDFTPQEISNLMWALTKLDVSPDAELLRAMLDNTPLKELTAMQGRQLHQFFVFNSSSDQPVRVTSWADLRAKCDE
jgi:hypothetical protein